VVRDLAIEFEAERDHLMAVAYRMLGSRTEAEDAVQETWLRYAGALTEPADRAQVRDLRGWLTTTIGRICLDVLRSARVRREAYPGQWLPEPVVSRLPGPAGAGTGSPTAGVDADGFAPDPADRAVRVDQVGIALLVLLERLTPEQRVAFVLHDVFAVPFVEIAAALDVTPATARQLASRGRRALADGGPRQGADLAEQRRVLGAFLSAAESGDLDRLVQVLAPGVVFVGDGGGYLPTARNPISGANQVARFTLGLFRRRTLDTTGMRGRSVLVNDGLGIHCEADHRSGHRMRFVMWFTVEGDRITGVFNQANPEKLTSLPELAPGDGDWPPRL
jgi:RNA polymerase sigma-70 factor (ECF subfamily)